MVTAVGGGPGVWVAGGVALRVVVGLVSVLGGALAVVMELAGGDRQANHLVLGAVLAAGGAALLLAHRLRVPWRVGAAGAAVAAVAGTAGSLLWVVTAGCCMFVYHIDRGYPFGFLHRGATADDAQRARLAAQVASSHVEVPALLADAVFWAYVGLLAVTAGVLGWRGARRESRSPVG